MEEDNSPEKKAKKIIKEKTETSLLDYRRSISPELFGPPKDETETPYPYKSKPVSKINFSDTPKPKKSPPESGLALVLSPNTKAENTIDDTVNEKVDPEMDADYITVGESYRVQVEYEKIRKAQKKRPKE